MPRKRSMVDYGRCKPDRCEGGVCLAAQACPNKVMRQEAPYEMPDVHPTMCVGCGMCMQACPLGAVRVM